MAAIVVGEEHLFSQKAKGLVRLNKHRSDTLPVAFIPGGSHRPVIYGEMEKFFTQHKHPVLFVRPCPESPNHGGEVAGFQSEAVKREASIQQVWKVRQAIAKKNLRADIVVMPYVHADLSCVVAPGKYYVWGLGNNGVTAGTSETVVIPINPKNPGHYFLSAAGYDPKTVEVEFVRDKANRKVYCVQIRAASAHLDIDPAPEGALPGFVPGGKMTVVKTYQVKDLNDLGELEFLKGTDTAGLLVIQPTGSMLSHAAAHCRGAKIAFCIGKPDIKPGSVVAEPASGWLVVGDVEAKPYDPATYWADFRRGFDAPLIWESMKLGTFFHQWATKPLGSPNRVAYLGGRFCKWLVQAGITAFCGESRHTDCVHNKGDWGGYQIHHHYVNMTGEHEPQRATILKMLRDSHATLPDLLKVAQWTHQMFSLSWMHSMGGYKWQMCAASAINSIEAIMKGDCSAAITALNALENGVHNGGKLFNKFHESLKWLDIATAGVSMDTGETGLSSEIAEVALLTKFNDTPVKESSIQWATTAALADIVIPKMGNPKAVQPSVTSSATFTDNDFAQKFNAGAMAAMNKSQPEVPPKKSAMVIRPKKGI